ncbi:MlaD family protein [Azospirillum sp. SYSU D00513]|uniref:PqiB family protein n=1 Tax=Azospirillum sp. SYSU D00513 TaxID=2812561 RepID=UPI001A95AD99|nr:MlaD family protein [Azospirillum sp. SYSU D00513]
MEPQRPENTASAENAAENAVEPAAAHVRRRRTLPLVWIVPLVAALLGGWLVWQHFSERGPLITITFVTAEGIEAGRTKIKFKNVDVGTVEAVAMSADLSHVVVTARMVKDAGPYLTGGTRFWVVKPRLGAAGISGLTTLVSGAYIGVDPGPGEWTTEFSGLEEPPLVQSSAPGRRFVLTTDRLGGLSPGVPIYYAGIQVGEVLGYEFTRDWSSLNVPVFVHAPYDRLVRPNSRFWNASGVQMSFGSNGPSVAIESLQALAAGGVAFDTPGLSNEGEAAEEGRSFPLFENQRSAEEARYTRRLPLQVQFDGSVRGLNPGSAVEFRGIKIGEVTDIRLSWDPETRTARIPVTMRLEPERVDIASEDDRATYGILAGMVSRGLRAQLRTGNYLTGEMIVALNFFPDAAPGEMDLASSPPMLPAQPAILDAATQSLSSLLDQLSRAPIADTIADLRRTVQSAANLLGGPETVGAANALRSTLTELERTMQTVNGEVGPTLRALRETSENAATLAAQATTTLKTTNDLVGGARPVTHDLLNLVRELSAAARSIRVLTDYLERHPEALIQGKR